MRYLPAIPIRRELKASRRWFGCARFRTVLLKITINSSCLRRKAPVRGLSSVFSMTPSLTHCQNCACVVQNCLRSRQITSAVRFFFFFTFFVLTTEALLRVSLKYTAPLACTTLLASINRRESRCTPKGNLISEAASVLSKHALPVLSTYCLQDARAETRRDPLQMLSRSLRYSLR